MGNGLSPVRRIAEWSVVAASAAVAALTLQPAEPAPEQESECSRIWQEHVDASDERCEVLLSASARHCAEQLGHCEAACAIK
jgi:hypothetical protein